MRRHHVYQNLQLESTLAVGCLVSVYVFSPAVDLLIAYVHGKMTQEHILQPFRRLLLPKIRISLAYNVWCRSSLQECTRMGPNAPPQS